MKTQIKFYALLLLLSSSQLIAMEDEIEDSQSEQNIETSEEYQDIYNLLELMKETKPGANSYEEIDCCKSEPFLWASFSLMNHLENTATLEQLKIIVKIIEKDIKGRSLKHKDFSFVSWHISKISTSKATEELEILSKAKVYMRLAKILHEHGIKLLYLLSDASGKNRVDWIEFLVSTLGYNVNDKENGYYIPLINAVENNNFKAAEKLIELGANVNLGRPLANSVRNKNLKITKLLLKNGATLTGEAKVVKNYEHPKKEESDSDKNSKTETKEVKGLVLKGAAKKIVTTKEIVDPKSQKTMVELEFENW